MSDTISETSSRSELARWADTEEECVRKDGIVIKALRNFRSRITLERVGKSSYE